MPCAGRVFDGDRLASNVALANARFNGLAAAYGRSVVTAVAEVEVALAGMRRAARYHALLAGLWEEVQVSLELRSQRYVSGVGGFADFLDAGRTSLDVESAIVGAERPRRRRSSQTCWTRPLFWRGH